MLRKKQREYSGSKRLWGVFLLLIISLLVMVSCGQNPDVQGEDNKDPLAYDVSWTETTAVPVEEGRSTGLENMKTLDLYGNVVDSTIFQDYTITIVDVWGTYCNPCIQAMPTLAEIYHEYEPQGVNVIGIMIDVQNGDYTPKPEYIAKAMEITDGTGADFMHLLSSKNIVSSVVRNISAIPASFVVDSQGNVITKISYGSHTKEEWEEIIHEYLQ